MLLCTITHCLSLKSSVVLLKLAVSSCSCSPLWFFGFLVIACSVSPDSETMGLPGYFLFGAASILNSTFSLPLLTMQLFAWHVSWPTLHTPTTSFSHHIIFLSLSSHFSIHPSSASLSVSPHVSVHWFGGTWGGEDWEIHLVLTKSREYKMLFTDQDMEGLWIMRDGYHGDVFCCSWESWEEVAMTCIQELISLWAAVLRKSGSNFPSSKTATFIGTYIKLHPCSELKPFQVMLYLTCSKCP